ncbi:protein-glutamate methylesterase/protein-glutamine glutaminase [Desulfobotulus mexicanus]|uniref:Protein-glutamate methylesterase/protein-glutamine glutaminase n=1 Tax=Desulfobotulus mexicanus TaxID=2586642 RepID=A0A5Q4VAP0_9BACT|nr:chemotaxis response regulator protein-glutamate methylesterase [Desulfobotulus mexicanus]TYT74789.1 chemotaxis response regulator protein-glutamate methylesterase [Desulfobotulus mexicanus]
MSQLRILVVDDTIVYRKIVSDILSTIPGVQVVGSANNGKVALSRISALKPDLITLDVEMPEMNGLEVLEELHRIAPEVGVVMLSTLTTRGSDITIRALELGAFDFVPKPQSGSMAENLAAVRSILVPIIQTFQRRKDIRERLRGMPSPPVRKTFLSGTAPAPSASSTAASDIGQRMQKLAARRSRSEIVAIGISTGGPNALARMMPMLPGEIGVPILIVQHMPPIFTASLAKSLNAKCAIQVKEAEQGEIIKSNIAYIAPGGKQMKVVAAGDGKNRVIKITDDPPENSCRPSADYLFRSVASHYVGRATGVIMTGMGSDGSAGLREMKNSGAHIIAQDEASCTVFGMPKEPIESGITDIVVSLNDIASAILKTVRP